MTNIKQCARFLVLGLVFLLPACAVADVNHLVISQIQLEGDGGANDEFIEIHNPTAAPILMSGWSLQYKSFSGGFPLASGNRKNLPQTCLPAGGYFLAVGGAYNGSAAGDAAFSFSLSGASTGATVFLAGSSTLVSSANDAIILDKFAYGNSANNFPQGAAVPLPNASGTPAGDWAFVRGGYANDNSLDFTVQQSAAKNLAGSGGAGSCDQNSAAPSASSTADSTASTTPGSAQSASSTAESTASSTASSAQSASSTAGFLTKSVNVKIFQFLPNPGGDDPGKEWVELKNSGAETVLLDGWLLDDKNTGSGPGPDAFALGGSLAAGEIKKFVLPAAAFALNNTGGDEVNLYFSDKTLAHSAPYSAAAYDDGIFEFRDGQWQPPAQAQSGGGGGGGGGGSGGSAAAGVVYSAALPFRLNEIFPNPVGDDAGKEWVEIYNAGNATGSLEGYFLAHGDSDAWSSSAWLLPKDTLVAPFGVLAIILPREAFVLNNSGREKVKLFSPQKQLMDFVIYQDAPEAESWAKDEAGTGNIASQNKWNWSIPTFSRHNNSLPALARLAISEILPLPLTDQDEFVEIFNNSTSTVDLGGFILSIGTRTKILDEGAMLPPSGYLALFADDLPVALRNSGQELLLKDSYGRAIASVKYPKAQPGEAYALTDAGSYFWTQKPTAGQANEFVLAAANITPAALPPAAGNKPESKSVIDYSKLLKSNRELNDKIDLLQNQLGQLTQSLADNAKLSLSGPQANPPPAEPKQESGLWYLAVAGTALLLLVLLIKKFFWEPKSPMKSYTK